MIFFRPLAFATAVLLGSAGLQPARAAANSTPAGGVIVARATSNALLLWDATAEVKEIVAAKTADDAANEVLKRAMHSHYSPEKPRNSKRLKRSRCA